MGLPRVIAGLAAALTLAGSAWAGPESSWPDTLSPHYDVHHEDVWLPPGFLIQIERVHSRLRMDLAMFSPWMAQERVKLYLYASPDSYAAGSFGAPAWSNGLALYESKTILMYDQTSRQKLYQILAHETTHILFESYWGEMHKRPPSWLNEGLAMLEEADSPMHPESSDWYLAMSQLPGQKLYSLDQLTQISPMGDLKDKSNIATWYTQSYSVVYFLFRTHSKLQFKTFVSDLREGTPLEKALWLVYRYHSIDDFEQAWLAWLEDPQHKQRIAAAQAMKASGKTLDTDFESSFNNNDDLKPIGGIDGFQPLKAGH